MSEVITVQKHAYSRSQWFWLPLQLAAISLPIPRNLFDLMDKN
jgi:hypothetical protein